MFEEDRLGEKPVRYLRGFCAVCKYTQAVVTLATDSGGVRGYRSGLIWCA